MGQKQRNIETVTDFADNRHFIRLHRDILLPAQVCEAVRRNLEAGRWDEAKMIALEHAPADAQDEIRLFFTSTLKNPAPGKGLESLPRTVEVSLNKEAGADLT
jgi:hypothetical protein